MEEVRRLGIWSVAKIHAIIGLVIGFLVGMVYVAIGAIGMATGMPQAAMLLILGIAMPFLAAIGNLITGAIGAAIYNLAAKVVGGVEIELQ